MRTLLQALGASAIAGAVLPTLIAIIWATSIGSFDLIEVLQHRFIMTINTSVIGLTFTCVGLIKGQVV